MTLPDNIPVSRLAPTPSGYLHLGNVANFLLTWLMVRRRNGKLLLRIDDLDSDRVRTEYLEDIFETLDWLGIDYDIGPSGVEDFKQHYSQQHRLPLYMEWLDKLSQKGALYACTCTRKMVRDRYPNGCYQGFCKTKNLTLQYAGAVWRLDCASAPAYHFPILNDGQKTINLLQTMGDPVLRKADCKPAYQIASISDDITMGINLVVRGEDLLPGTACQVFIHETIFGQAPSIQWIHHPLATHDNGEKLSKSAGATSIHYLRRNGVKPAEVLNQCTKLFNWKAVPKAALAKDLLDSVEI